MDVNTTLLGYADDFVVISSGNNVNNLIRQTNVSLTNLYSAFSKLGFSLSLNKSRSILFQKRNIHQDLPNIYWGTNVIQWSTNIKYLGMILDSNLKWKLHIDFLAKRAIGGINAMRAISRVWWGAHPCTLSMIYKGIVRSHLDYGSIIMGNCNKKLLEKLDKIQFQALRIIIGAMKSTPTNALLAETCEWPLRYRRTWLACKYIFKSLSFENSPLTALIYTQFANYNQKQVLPTPSPIIEATDLFIYFKDIIQKQNIIPCYRYGYHLQMGQQISYVDSGLDKSSLNNHPDFIRMMKDKWPSSTYIFTDGSLDPVQKKVGIGVYIPNENVSLALRAQDYYSICSAEVMAIQIAIKKALLLKIKDFLILSDSKSALDRLSRNGLVTDNDWITLSTRKSYFLAKAQNRNVQLVWIPSHTNIQGNDKADLIAKTGRALTNINLTKVDFRDILTTH